VHTPVVRRAEEVARGEIVARLVNPDALEIRPFVPLRHVRAIQPGNVVKVTIDRRSFTAVVSSIVPTGDPRAERGDVRAGLADGDWIGVEGKLAPGDEVVVRRGELLRGDEKLQVVGLFETNR
jgi:multidrug efflux pump subunit AcrA (membrane-fusion protein)